jgi:hypothetical protein
MDLKEGGWEGVDWINPAQDSNWLRAVVNTVINFRVPCTFGNFFTSWGDYWLLKEESASNVAVEWLAFLLHIRDISGWNLGPETDNPDWRSSWFSSIPPGKCWDSTLNYAATVSFLTLSSSLFIIWLCIIWTIDSVVK